MTPYHGRLRAIRTGTPDPDTHRPYSQAKIARLLGRSSTYMGTLEAGGIDTPPPDIVNAIAHILPYSAADQLRDMGYEIPDSPGLSDDEKELIETFRRLSCEQQQAVLAVAKTLRSTEGQAVH